MAESKKPQGYVGFANLPNQVHRRSVKKGFEFTVMVVGESGLGKSTLVNSLFLTDVYEQRDYPPAQDRIEQTVKINAVTNELEEKGVRLQLTIVDTPGFGDAVNNSDCWSNVVQYVDEQFEAYLNDESRVNRKKFSDRRVHACLYFIAPTCHGLKPLDLAFMKALHEKVNIIPLIAKCDTLTKQDCEQFKKKILSDIEEAGIKIYHSTVDSADEEDDVAENAALEAAMPFAVCGSTDIIEVGGKQVRGRKYPWGIVEVENEEHSDFSLLRSMLIRTHMQDLLASTHDVHYENFRAKRLSDMAAFADGDVDATPMAKMEAEMEKMARMEDEMRHVFQMKVNEKEKKLKENEIELTRRHEELAAQLKAERDELEAKTRVLEQARVGASQAPDKHKKDKKISRMF